MSAFPPTVNSSKYRKVQIQGHSALWIFTFMRLNVSAPCPFQDACKCCMCLFIDGRIGLFINWLSHVAVSWKSFEMQISATRCWGGRGGSSRVQTVQNNVQCGSIVSCNIQLLCDEGRGGGRWEMMSIYRMKRSRCPGQPDFTPPLPTHPSMSVLPMICLFSKLSTAPAIF